jgi:hypothetical protein
MCCDAPLDTRPACAQVWAAAAAAGELPGHGRGARRCRGPERAAGCAAVLPQQPCVAGQADCAARCHGSVRCPVEGRPPPVHITCVMRPRQPAAQSPPPPSAHCARTTKQQKHPRRRHAPVSPAVSGALMVGLLLAFMAAFALGSGPVTWLLLSEVLPPRIKGPAGSLATAAGWAGACVRGVPRWCARATGLVPVPPAACGCVCVRPVWPAVVSAQGRGVTHHASPPRVDHALPGLDPARAAAPQRRRARRHGHL